MQFITINICQSLICDLLNETCIYRFICFTAKLLVTPFKDAVVPPPMAAYTVQMPCAINQVAFSAENNDFAVMMSDGCIAVFSFGEKGEPCSGM